MDQANNDNGTGTGTSSLDLDTRITSIAWKPSTVNPLLATTTSSSLSLWDLRSAPQGSTSSAAFKPTLRFGTARKTFAGTSPLVQVACSSDSDECATIDASGIVRVYDIRMTERARSFTGSPVSAFAAHETAGVGISYFRNSNPTQNSNGATTTSRWLTWGLDAPLSSAVVKIWSNEPQSQLTRSTPDPDDYWFMGSDKTADQSSPRHNKTLVSLATPNSEYHLTAQCARPNLACARVCASPVENTFMAVGHLPSDGSKPDAQGGWWAELFALSNEEKQKNDSTFGLTRVTGFQGGSATNSLDKKALISVLGGRVDLGRLQAAELAFSGASYRPRSISADESNLSEKQEDENNDVELLLCCLSDTGVVTTHVSTRCWLPKLISFALPTLCVSFL
jgi:hypothetical protein